MTGCNVVKSFKVKKRKMQMASSMYEKDIKCVQNFSAEV